MKLLKHYMHYRYIHFWITVTTKQSTPPDASVTFLTLFTSVHLFIHTYLLIYLYVGIPHMN